MGYCSQDYFDKQGFSLATADRRRFLSNIESKESDFDVLLLDLKMPDLPERHTSYRKDV